jgi:hypothetical protein
MAKQKIVDREKKRDKARRYSGDHFTLSDGRTVGAWVTTDDLGIEFHGSDLKTACTLAVERASEAELKSGELLIPRGLLVEVEAREYAGGDIHPAD